MLDHTIQIIISRFNADWMQNIVRSDLEKAPKHIQPG